MTIMIRSIFPTAALIIALGACSVPETVSPEQAARNETTPGWTGRTFVMGSSSTIAGDAQATYLQQKWGIGRSR